MNADIGSSDEAIIENSEASALRDLGYRLAFDELGVKDDPAHVGLLTQTDKDYYEALKTTDPKRYDLAFQAYINMLDDY